MAKRRTDIALHVEWDDELTDHPGGWEWGELVNANPFENDSRVTIVSFVDVDEDGNPEQV